MAQRKQETTIQEKAISLLASQKAGKGRPKKWENYTTQEKKMAIAFDVIQGVLAGVYEPTEGTYIATWALTPVAHEYESKGRLKDVDVQEVLQEGALEDCPVCALGACYLSLVRFADNQKLTDLIGEDRRNLWNNGGDLRGIGSARKRMIDLFGVEQLSLIESAFEYTELQSDLSNKVPMLKLTKAVSFGKKYTYGPRTGYESALEARTERILAIWLNVIENNGEFKP